MKLFLQTTLPTKRMKALLNAATDSVHKWDPTRLVAIGGCQRRGLDQLGKNQIAFYNGDGATFAAPGVPTYGIRIWKCNNSSTRKVCTRMGRS